MTRLWLHHNSDMMYREVDNKQEEEDGEGIGRREFQASLDIREEGKKGKEMEWRRKKDREHKEDDK